MDQLQQRKTTVATTAFSMAFLLLISTQVAQAQVSFPETIAPGRAIENIPQHPPLVDVRITGNKRVSEAKIRSMIKSRAGREFDPEMVQSDTRKLASSGMFRDVKPVTKKTPQGLILTFQLIERPTIQFIRFIGNESVPDKTLQKKSGLEPGTALNRFLVEEARSRLQEFYVTRGHGKATVSIAEGNKKDDAGVAFMIHEGPLARIWKTEFIGNSIASDGRLKTQIKSKPGILWYFKGIVDKEQVASDVNSLISYYRGLGYFKAEINRILEYNESGQWATVSFVIDEGPRYQIRTVSFIGQTLFTRDDLDSQVSLAQNDFFDLKRMNKDVSSLTDLYGSQGYIHADIKAEPRFLEEPGLLDLVYDISEGDQYRVGKIDVVISGDNPHTSRDVILNRLDLVPGEIIDIRKIRESEIRIKRSGLFVNEPQRGITPTIQVKPPELKDLGPQIGSRPSRSTYRGQSPTPSYRPVPNQSTTPVPSRWSTPGSTGNRY
ncbi:MAG: hypothetical protein COA78_31650 [Blastopirellula sp.]|nr:MAG: hypothetical protein COA78_31650 [Blastopirellula sp.]